MMSPSASAHELRLLIADDDPGTVRLLMQILKGLGKIHFTTDPTQVVDMAQSLQPDLILLDVEMPGLDGIHICSQIKQDPAFEDVPILFVTSHDHVEVETRALRAGAIDFIAKPPNPLVVRARVGNYLSLKQRTDQLRRLTTTDGLTGVANRRAFDEALELEWRRSCRGGTPLSLLMIDVDYFKRFNDAYGHLAGDDCLRAIATTLTMGVRRPGELLSRYGGEEFVALLPNCDTAQALRLAELLLRDVRALGIPHVASEAAAHVTISVGAASFSSLCRALASRSPDHGECVARQICELGAARLVSAADQALYTAKGTGRDRVQLHAEPAYAEPG